VKEKRGKYGEVEEGLRFKFIGITREGVDLFCLCIIPVNKLTLWHLVKKEKKRKYVGAIRRAWDL